MEDEADKIWTCRWSFCGSAFTSLAEMDSHYNRHLKEASFIQLTGIKRRKIGEDRWIKVLDTEEEHEEESGKRKRLDLSQQTGSQAGNTTTTTTTTDTTFPIPSFGSMPPPPSLPSFIHSTPLSGDMPLPELSQSIPPILPLSQQTNIEDAETADEMFGDYTPLSPSPAPCPSPLPTKAKPTSPFSPPSQPETSQSQASQLPSLRSPETGRGQTHTHLSQTFAIHSQLLKGSQDSSTSLATLPLPQPSDPIGVELPDFSSSAVPRTEVETPSIQPPVDKIVEANASQPRSPLHQKTANAVPHPRRPPSIGSFGSLSQASVKRNSSSIGFTFGEKLGA